MVIKNIDIISINSVFMKLTKEIEDLRQSISSLDARVSALENPNS